MMNTMKEIKALEKEIAKAEKRVKMMDAIFGGFIVAGALMVLVMGLIVA